MESRPKHLRGLSFKLLRGTAALAALGRNATGAIGTSRPILIVEERWGRCHFERLDHNKDGDALVTWSARLRGRTDRESERRRAFLILLEERIEFPRERAQRTRRAMASPVRGFQFAAGGTENVVDLVYLFCLPCQDEIVERLALAWPKSVGNVIPEVKLDIVELDMVGVERRNLVALLRLVVRDVIESSMKLGRMLDSDHIPLQ
ncbi:unnamed protein product, partial [Darwinula stevensoni]